jgi:hypothetical protein
MNNKKFYKLNNNYKHFLLYVDNNLTYNIDETISLKKIIEIHKKIEDGISKYELEINDINHLLLNYDKENEILIKLKKIVYYKNFLILKNVMRTTEWKKFIIELTEFVSLKLNKKILIKDIENIFMELLKKYLGFWNGFWKFFNLNKNYTIKKISIIDPDDYTYIFSCIDK